MDIQTLRASLVNQPFGHTIHHHLSVPSTMPLARALAEKASDPALVSGTLVVADEQTAGRGRLDRRWVTPPGRALLVSVIVAGRHLPESPAQLPMVAGLAVLDSIRSISTIFRLKWPNDLVATLPTGPAKVAGLLVESSLDDQKIRYAVLGIGVNVNQRPHELPAPRSGGLPPASLYTLCGYEFDRGELLFALCHSLTDLLAKSGRPTAAEIHARWQGGLINVGRPALINAGETADTSWRGKVVGTEMDGSLLVKDAAGQLVRVAAGDVSVEW